MNDGVGERIKAARITRGVSQAELAHAVGISNSYMSHIEAGRRPVGDAIKEQIAARLGMEAKQLDEGVPSDAREELQLQLSFAEMALRNGNWDLAVTSFDEALESAQRLPMNNFVHEATWGRARALEASGRLEEAIGLYEDLHSAAIPTAVVPQTTVAVRMIRAYSEAGDLSRAIDVGEKALSDHEAGDADPSSEVELLSTLAGCYLERGDLTRAHLLIQDALERSDRDGSLRARAAAAWNAAVIADTRHEVANARLYADRALAMYQEMDNSRAVALVRVVSAALLLRQEVPDPTQALTALGKAAAELTEVGTELDLAYVSTQVARAQLLSGDLVEARRTAEAALSSLGDGDRLHRGHVHLVLGHVARAQGDDAAALAAFRAAAEALSGAEAERQAAGVWRELGEAYAEMGQPAAAIEALRAASDLAGARFRPVSLEAASRHPVSQ